jgi:mannose-6-phosphate isomerase-like protein (cupin superfamily)
MSTQIDPITIPAEGRERVDLGGLGIVWKIEGAEADERFSVVHHPLAPRALAAPLHRHSREDEYSYVLEGTLGALLGDDAVTAGPGTWVFKPRDQWHTFWNAGDEPCRILEIISPSGFEKYFNEMVDLIADGPPDIEKLVALGARYGLEADPASIPGLLKEHGLVHPMFPAE